MQLKLKSRPSLPKQKISSAKNKQRAFCEQLAVALLLVVSVFSIVFVWQGSLQSEVLMSKLQPSDRASYEEWRGYYSAYFSDDKAKEMAEQKISRAVIDGGAGFRQYEAYRASGMSSQAAANRVLDEITAGHNVVNSSSTTKKNKTQSTPKGKTGQPGVTSNPNAEQRNYDRSKIDVRRDPDKITNQEKIQAEEASLRSSGFLGKGFEDITKYSNSATNKLSERGGGFSQSGVRKITAVLYNAKDYIKYIAGSMAIVFLMVQALNLVTAGSDESIQKAKKGLLWAATSLIILLVTDVAVTAFFEGGDRQIVGESLVTIARDADGNVLRNPDGSLSYEQNTNLLASMGVYFTANAREIFDFIKVYGALVAVLFIFIAGWRVITASGNEEHMEKQKKYLMHSVTAFITLLMLPVFIFQVIYPETTVLIKGADGVMHPVQANSPECLEYLNYAIGSTELPDGCASGAQLGARGSDYILGVVRFMESLLGGIAVFFIVLAGVRIISAMGNQEILDKNKKTLLWALAGLAVVVLSKNLILHFFFVTDATSGSISVNTSQGIIDLAGVVNFLSTFVGIFAMVSMIGAGIVWTANFGNTEVADKSKKVLIGALAAVILSISSYAIVNSLTQANPEGTRQTEVDISL